MADDTIELPWCPCQKELFGKRYPDLPPQDIPYVDETETLVRVYSHHYWERKREKARQDAPEFSMRSHGPSTPTTRRGEKIIEENFPDADFVCPYCEQEYVEEVTVRKA